MFEGKELIDLSSPMHPVECKACDHFGRKDASVAVWARQVGPLGTEWLLVCDDCRKALHWAKKNTLQLQVILQ